MLKLTMDQVSSQQPNISPVVVRPKTGIVKVIVNTLIIILLALSISANLFFAYKLNLLPLKLEDSNFAILPVDPANRELIDYGVSYYFETVIDDLQRTPQGIELDTPLSVPGLPNPVISNRAVIFKRDNGRLLDRTHDDIKRGQRVGLHFYMDKFKDWEVTRVILVTE